MLTGTALAQTSTDNATRVDELVASGKAVLLELNGALDPIGSGSTTADALVEDAAMAAETSDPLLYPMEEAEAEEMVEVVDDADARSMTVEVTEDSDAVSPDMVELTATQTEGEIEAEALPEPAPEESIEVAAIDTVMEESDVEDADDVVMVPLDNSTVELGDADDIGPYRLWLASFRNMEEAQARWDQLLKDNPDVLASLVPVLVMKDLGTDQGRFYRLQIGPLQSQTEAQEACAELEENHLYCTVLGPPDVEAVEP